MKPVADRFWAKVVRRGPDECWPWTASTNPKGYGYFGYGKGHIFAHRMAWMLCRGPVPDGLFVLHHCDNPGCVNPAHLFLGTNSDNLKDAASKGRLPVQKSSEHRRRFLAYADLHRRQLGERHGSHRVTEAQVREIRERAAFGETETAIAFRVGLSRSATGSIIRRETWTHI